MKIEGVVRHIKLGTGFWGISCASGDKYIPINMPEQLKNEGQTVVVEAEMVPNMGGMHMWGDYVRITSFDT